MMHTLGQPALIVDNPVPWHQREEFWLGISTSLIAGIFIFLIFEWHK